MRHFDWSEVMQLANAMQGIHEANIELTMSIVTQGARTMLACAASAWVPTVEPQQTRDLAAVSGTWPDREHPEFAGFVFNLLYDLDRAIGQSYAQKELPE